MAEDWRNGGFGLYIHWPFCQSKCPYCDFNSHVAETINQDRWVRAYVSEIRRYAAETKDRVLNTVFFGGGTPSLMTPETVNTILDEVRAGWTLANDVEITLEANPGSVEAARFAGYADAGVNRVSMGFQALNNRDLKRLGRLHSVEEARQAFDIARKSFDRVSFDLIYARQDQSLSDWTAELSEALSMGVDHLSLYQLTIEQGTAFGDRYNAGKLRGLPEDDDAADMYLATQEICEKAGMPAYEVSNHAQPDQESRHNQIYWRYGDYVGIGPGAHGRLTLGGARCATDTLLAPGAWLKAAEGGNGDKSRTQLSNEDQAVEYLMMSLRLSEGSDIERYQQLSGKPMPEDAVDNLLSLGLIDVDNRALRATTTGRPVLNGVLRELLA
ncbi:MAG: radical SAM family heme chaperone HemW [Paracoccaceae bacterium]|nr:radical SAM family heme chaperone HemW [Paracoccaceae bacterium]MDG1738413.1 radical SAM family heme chaperone HemW [Paracoccaceae bacterium]MDG2259840.1 radical SAM family heme chaperone HemW [Paracoccaceae bacterium]